MSGENEGKVDKNSDILFIYEAKMCNPNGDPDDENKPRIDYERSINLVSDVRLKRYIRDYLMAYKEEKGDVFVAKVEGKTVDATNRLKKLIKKYDDEIKKSKELKDLIDNKGQPQEKKLSNHLSWLLSKLIDVRLFGATMPLKSEEGKGSSITFTGPVQFNWGYSLNKVDNPIESNTITSTFAGAGETKSTMGKDYRVAYSIIAFHGIISAKRAEKTELKWDDINLLDDAMINAIPLEATTRSKIGQHPLLYMRIEYKTDDFFLDDLRKYVKIVDNNGEKIPFEKTEKLRSVEEYKLSLSLLSNKLKDFVNKINKIYIWKNNELEIEGWDMIDKENNKFLGDKNEIPVVELKFDNNKDDGNDESRD